MKARARKKAVLKSRIAEVNMEEGVVRMQIDYVNTVVTDDESANLGYEVLVNTQFR